MLLPPPRSALFPYTTLFRSLAAVVVGDEQAEIARQHPRERPLLPVDVRHLLADVGERRRHLHRSEEHTSELQSQFHLVCRLLLEKKKTSTRCARGRRGVPRS